MTRTPTPRPRADNPLPAKPYELVSFPEQSPTLESPAGHEKYLSDRIHGQIALSLQVATALHVSTGVVVMGSDVNSRVPLIKTMTQGTAQTLSIQGSSLKGCVRAVYEAITNSTLAVITSRYQGKIPTERLPCHDKNKLCPASQVFGALDWQGLIEFSDARCNREGFTTGFMPSLYRPRPDKRRAYFLRGRVAGRKFYYHTTRAIDKGQNQGIAVQQAGKAYLFETQLNFKNLSKAELGTLLVVLGQDPEFPIALKVGGGKPIGMGTMTVKINSITKVEGMQALRDRYSSYNPDESEMLTGDRLQEFIQQTIQAAHRQLIEKAQLGQLMAVLRYPTDREPPSGMY